MPENVSAAYSDAVCSLCSSLPCLNSQECHQYNLWKDLWRSLCAIRDEYVYGPLDSQSSRQISRCRLQMTLYSLSLMGLGVTGNIKVSTYKIYQPVLPVFQWLQTLNIFRMVPGFGCMDGADFLANYNSLSVSGNQWSTTPQRPELYRDVRDLQADQYH